MFIWMLALGFRLGPTSQINIVVILKIKPRQFLKHVCCNVYLLLFYKNQQKTLHKHAYINTNFIPEFYSGEQFVLIVVLWGFMFICGMGLVVKP
jgi:hypothetical protein